VSRGTQRIRVYIADDHPLYREGVVGAVRGRPDFEFVGEAGDGNQALAEIRRLKPDVALLDFKLPGLDGVRVLNALRRDAVDTRVMVLSAYVESALVYRAVAAGAAGYWSKDADRTVICDAIAAVARGESVLDPSLQAGVFGEIHSREVDDERPVLTEREQEILGLVARGLTAPAIGKELFLSPATVKTHLGHLYEKLGVGDRAAAVAEARRRGLLE
jgi:two-component system nitrate/nitrite response regulator NarL